MGALLWKEIECKSILKGRSWESIRGRFLRHTIGNLKELKVKELVEADEKAKTERLAATGRTWPKLQYTRDEDEEILEYIVEKQQFSRVGGHALFKEMAAEKVAEGQSWASMMYRFQDQIIKDIASYGLSEEQVSFFRNKTIIKDADGQIAAGPSRANQRYSPTEDKMILHYIAKKNAYNKVRGDKLWKKMKNVVGDRSWISMKRRFSRVLIKNIEKKSNTYDLDEGQLSLFINRGEMEDGREDEESEDEEGEEEEEEVDEDERMGEDERMDEVTAGLEDGGEMEVDEAEMEDEEFHPARILVNF